MSFCWCSSPAPSASRDRNGRVELACPHADSVSPSQFKRLLCDYLEEQNKSKNKTMCCQECRGTEDLWICVNCSAILCMRESDGTSHALSHFEGKCGNKCHLFLSCVDSHIFCCTCGQYLYPREIAQVCNIILFQSL